MTDFQPFEAASNRTSVVVWTKGRATTYPVPYSLWQKTAYGQSITQGATLKEALAMTRRLPFVAEPVNRDDPTSAWLTARPQAAAAIRRLLRPSEYVAHEGVNSGGANGVYWIEVVHQRPDGMLVVRNIAEAAKRGITQINAVIEPDLVFPLLRGREVRRWHADRSAYIILAQDPSARQGINERVMQRQYPKTFAYLKHFEAILLSRKDRGTRQIIEHGGPFYSMFSVGEYTMSRYKAVWHRMVAPIEACVVGCQDGDPILPQETHVFVPCPTKREAQYIVGMMNSQPFNFAALAYSQAGGKSFGSPQILQNLYVPEFDTNDGKYRRVADLAAAIQDRFGELSDEDLAAAEAELDEAAAAVWGITGEELAEIRQNFCELTKADLRDARQAEIVADADDNNGDGSELSDECEAVLTAMAGNGEMTATEVAAAVGVNTADLRPLLRELIEAGRVEQIGRGRGTRYKLAEGGEG